VALNISAAVLMLFIVVVLIRRSGLKFAHALVCALLGFYLASSSIAPSIQQVTSNLAGMLNGLRL
jgi:ABC-type polysaccharide/polyol phosphate export permease